MLLLRRLRGFRLRTGFAHLAPLVFEPVINGLGDSRGLEEIAMTVVLSVGG